MHVVPWLIDGPVARPEAGWEPTPGCKVVTNRHQGVRITSARICTERVGGMMTDVHVAILSKSLHICEKKMCAAPAVKAMLV